MKTILTLLMLFAMICCSPEDAIPEEPVVSDFDTSTAELIKSGMLQGINHTASGTASIYTQMNETVVVLDPFESQNGPDLKVYLSKDVTATEYLRLGQLKSTMGKQTYTIPSNYNIDDYHYVHIWCEKFSVEFARAELKK